jgi:nitric oxide reductase subunit B
MRTNTCHLESGMVTVSNERATAIARTTDHYLALFNDDSDLAGHRESYALHEGALPDPVRRKALTSFFFRTAWAATTQHPDTAVSYTNNWPHEPLVGNHATAASLIGSIVSIAFLLAGVGSLVWYKLLHDCRPSTICWVH